LFDGVCARGCHPTPIRAKLMHAWRDQWYSSGVFILAPIGSAKYVVTLKGLFEKIRLPGLSAMYKVGYGAQCCRGANGDANTPYNKTCTGTNGALAPHATWLNVPLLFNMSVDVVRCSILRVWAGFPCSRMWLIATPAVEEDAASICVCGIRSYPTVMPLRVTFSLTVCHEFDHNTAGGVYTVSVRNRRTHCGMEVCECRFAGVSNFESRLDGGGRALML
jgi:hypothetical protein